MCYQEGFCYCIKLSFYRLISVVSAKHWLFPVLFSLLPRAGFSSSSGLLRMALHIIHPISHQGFAMNQPVHAQGVENTNLLSFQGSKQEWILEKERS